MIVRIAATGTLTAILLATLSLPSSALADFEPVSRQQPDASARWSASGGSTSLRFDPDLLAELQISVSGPATPAGSEMPGEFEFSINHRTTLDFWAPWAAWDGFASGALDHDGPLVLEWPGGLLSADGFSLTPVSPEVFELIDNAGNALFRLDYVHTMLYPEEKRMTLWNMDMSLTPWLAGRMGYDDMAGLVIASAFTQTGIRYPATAALERPEGGGCSVPNWHDGVTFFNDVELSSLGSVQQVARQAGVRVAIAPSATLRNVGTADVPWYQKFTTEPPETFDDYPEPYSRDQHPFLVWAMYRVVDDIPQQIGQSAIKHAFFTVNGACSCPGGSILWAQQNSGNNQGCTDTYGVGTNDSPTHLGIRDNLPAFTGEFEQCGSIFAPGATPPGPCTQTFSGNTSDPFERRLVVEESELQTPNATYYFEGWYVIRDDIDIFNTLAYKQVTPTFGSSWSFPAGPHTQGPAINAWVPPNTRGSMQAHHRDVTSAGHYSVAVKVTDLGGGQFRYVYALMNYDFDPRFQSFALGVPNGTTLSNIQYLDGDSNSGNDWAVDTSNGQLTFTAPGGGALEWGHMATFVFEADQAPVDSAVELTGLETPLDVVAPILGLQTFGELFKQGFENAPGL